MSVHQHFKGVWVLDPAGELRQALHSALSEGFNIECRGWGSWFRVDCLPCFAAWRRRMGRLLETGDAHFRTRGCAV